MRDTIFKSETEDLGPGEIITKKSWMTDEVLNIMEQHKNKN